MMVGIRTQELRKIYNSSPPFAAGAGSFVTTTLGRKRQPKPQIVALDGLSLDVSPGEIFGLLGPNGAGKSTTVGILTTRVRPSGGQAWIGEHDVWQEPVAVKRLIGVVGQRPNLDFSLTAFEILASTALISGCLRRNEPNEPKLSSTASSCVTVLISWFADFPAE
jgi:ABC-2 type transport system ATP-binding protein